VRVAKANVVLSNPETRERYDNLLKAGIYDYDEEAWYEREARRRGWRSEAEEEASDAWALFLGGERRVLSCVLCCARVTHIVSCFRAHVKGFWLPYIRACLTSFLVFA
jgi:curved DNA-binding protein CbpA